MNFLYNYHSFYFGEGCVNLTTINIPAYGKLEVIGEAAFCGTAITTLVIPANIKIINSQIVNGCNSLTTIDSRISSFYIKYSSGLDINWEPLSSIDLSYWTESFLVNDSAFMNRLMYGSYRLANNDFRYLD